MNNLLKISFALCLLFTACNSNEDPIVEEVVDLEIRLKNVSNYDYKNIKISTSEDHDYGDLNTGEITEYQIHSTAYNYCYVELLIDNVTYILQPIDFVGETPLAPGKYSYEINAADTGDLYDRLSIAAIED